MTRNAIYRYVVLLFSILCIATAAADDRYGKQKVVYHIDSSDAPLQVMALRYMQNHLDAVGQKNLELRVVLHGAGVSLLLLPEAAANTRMPTGNANDEMQARIAVLKDRGVIFHVCNNTLQGLKIDFLHDLYDVDASDVVPSGVAELSRLQQAGYTYIKP